MTINLKFAELHNALFLAGTNLQLKLDPTKRPIKLVYNRTEKELLVYFNDEVAIIPSSNISSMTPFNPADVGTTSVIQEETKAKAAPAPSKPIKAQASSPTDHVFAERK